MTKNDNVNYGRLQHPVSDQEVADVATLLSHLTSRIIPREAVAENLLELTKNRGNQFMAVAACGGHIVGMATLTLKPIPSERTAYVDDVVVHPAHRGAGVAGKLMGLLEDFAIQNEVDKIQLTSSDSRQAAIRLYGELGFKPKDTNVLVKELARSGKES